MSETFEEDPGLQAALLAAIQEEIKATCSAPKRPRSRRGTTGDNTCVTCTVILEPGTRQCLLCGTAQPNVAEPSKPDLPEPMAHPSQVDQLRSIELCYELVGHEFVDPDFPPVERGRVTAWLRPRDIKHHDGRPLRKGEDWQLFRGEPRAEDVTQGGLGDCWFLSALAALAEFRRGQFVKALFPGQLRLNKAGVYLVRLCLGGCWREIIVDDRLPCSGGGRYYTQVAYCATYRLQLWAGLIEKAFEKLVDHMMHSLGDMLKRHCPCLQDGLALI